MSLTERQETILKDLIERHIDLGLPIGSKVLARDFDFSPATIRIELKSLVDDGFLQTINEFSGRVPTEKAWELYVSSLIEGEPRISQKIEQKIQKLEKSFNEDRLEEFLNEISKNLNALSLILSQEYSPPLFKIGLERVFNNLEFRNPELYKNFINDIDYLEKNIFDFVREEKNELKKEKVKVMIGKDNPLCPSGEFSLILGANNDFDFFISFLGPKRMPYQKEINIIKELIKII